MCNYNSITIPTYTRDVDWRAEQVVVLVVEVVVVVAEQVADVDAVAHDLRRHRLAYEMRVLRGGNHCDALIAQNLQLCSIN